MLKTEGTRDSNRGGNVTETETGLTPGGETTGLDPVSPSRLDPETSRLPGKRWAQEPGTGDRTGDRVEIRG